MEAYVRHTLMRLFAVCCVSGTGNTAKTNRGNSAQATATHEQK